MTEQPNTERRPRPKIPLPKLQFKILELALAMGAGDFVDGGDIRDALEEAGMARSVATFYETMRRIKDAGMVEDRVEVVQRSPFLIRKKQFKVLGTGERAVHETRDFYAYNAAGGRGLVGG